MLKQERHKLILDKLKMSKKVLSKDLSGLLFVSEDTIRRDLKELEVKDLIYKVHGGALLKESRVRSYDERSTSDIEQKKKIAIKAVQLIKNGQVIIMSGSSTNLELAKIIPPKINATIYTYSLPIAVELSHHPSVEVIFIGGKLNKEAQVTVGIDVVKPIYNISADICFMGTDGIDLSRGLTEPNWEVSRIKNSMIETSNYVVVMCVSTRINSVKRHSVVPINKVDTIISDINPDNEIFDAFKAEKINIL
ncbi:DeoR/GlpR family DNA-binding transcription regulator [Neotamlana laminarinivorans]|uniref:DeoR/GlpR family DNA-binding transcription regulator n=1 Tax=Neotamlana laminarinivorans TaxID=2883124 RepID=A0A9X1L3F8_9FLAO|nr:DeoR/GlpR family DNA-binding transcription regulator [Tamlana laminarinivorans]MCB4798207.1 DeoR/GlpR family DNA-binding transcription regulator [Tamlana laminarinivorans]